MKAEHLGKMSEIDRKGQAERSRIMIEGSRQLAKTRQEGFDAQNKSWQDRQNAQDPARRSSST